MKIKIYKPKNEILQNRIESFYILQRNEDEKKITYLGFPSNNIFLTLCKDAEIIVKENDLIIENCQNNKVKSILTVDNKQQGSITYTGKVNEITIYFKPLGINAFLDKPLSNYIANTISEFYPFDDYNKAINEVFEIKDDISKIDFLENYLLTKLKEFDHPFLHEAVETIVNPTYQKITMSEIAFKNGISRVTLNKQFLLHLGTTPTQFKKIDRFRNAIKMFTENSTKEQLLDVAYLVDYFDQSHMSKDFKSLSGYSPKIFFSKVHQIENNQINWIFL